MSSTAKVTMPGPRTEVGPRGRTVVGVRWIFPAMEGRLTELGSRPISIGRDNSCDVVLDGDQISRRHAEIRREGLLFKVRDLGSRNGVYVDGARVNEGTLGLGGLLRLGEWLGILVEIPADRAEHPDGFREVVPGYWAGPTLWPVLEPLQAAAVTQVPVLIVGETGTGKEGVAKSVHAWSARSGRLVAVNCAAIPENLAEGELFGYRKGAFTGAERAHDGVVRAAHKGTLFLDEVADLPQTLQPKLLRALEQREVTPIGESTPVSVDVRMVAAMQQPLSQAVEEKRFRPDLYARLDGLTVKLPPLRERLDEVPFLFCQFLKHYLGGRAMPVVETPLVEALCRYAWPFNVRELDRVVQQLVALHGFERTLSRSMLPEKILAAQVTDTSSAAPRPTSEAALEALTQEGGNVRKAADRLLLSRQQLYRLLEGIPDFDLESFRKDLAARLTDEGAQ